MATGIGPPSMWADEGERTMATAVELLAEANRGAREAQEGEEQMSG